MDPIVELILKNGVLGLLAGVGFYLFFRQLKTTEKLTDQILQEQITDVAAKTKLTVALEDLVTTIELIGVQTSARMGVCQQHVTESMQKVQSFMSEEREARAKEEGRREATNPRFQIPTGERK